MPKPKSRATPRSRSTPRRPLSYSAALLGSKWTILILRELSDGPKRFSELESSLPGISPRTLAERLRWLESEAVISRKAYAEVPPRVDYALTPKGRDLRPVLIAMGDYERLWGPRQTGLTGESPGQD